MPPPNPAQEPAMPTESTPSHTSERYLPNHHFVESHSLEIRGSATVIHEAVAGFDPADDPVAKRLLFLREWPARLSGTVPTSKARFGLHDFTLLEHSTSDTVYGLIGRFWTADFGLVPIADAATFIAYNESAAAKLVMSFETDAIDTRLTRLTTGHEFSARISRRGVA
jgi:hypothetical protein